VWEPSAQIRDAQENLESYLGAQKEAGKDKERKLQLESAVSLHIQKAKEAG
jgi:hypothetical protein